MYAKKSGPTKKMRRTGVKALHAGRKRQSATAGRDTESNARTYQNILRVETESQRGQSGKTEVERPADAENQRRRKLNRGAPKSKTCNSRTDLKAKEKRGKGVLFFRERKSNQTLFRPNCPARSQPTTQTRGKKYNLKKHETVQTQPMQREGCVCANAG